MCNILNMCVLSNTTLKYVRQKLPELQEVHESTVRATEVSSPPPDTDTISREKVTKDTAGLNITLNQLDIIDVLPYFIQQQKKTFCPCLSGTFTKLHHILGLTL
jgi:hypothetical protein